MTSEKKHPEGLWRRHDRCEDCRASIWWYNYRHEPKHARGQRFLRCAHCTALLWRGEQIARDNLHRQG